MPRHRLSRSRDFDAVYRHGRSVSTRFLVLYWFAGVGPIYNAISGGQQAFAYLNSSGVSFVAIVFIVGIVWYVIQSARNRRAGVETALMYQMIPPD